MHSASLGDALDRWDITRTSSESVRTFFKAAPGGVPTRSPSARSRRFEELDIDRAARLHPRRRARLLAGTAASPCCTATSPRDGCIVKTAGVDDSILKFTGPARIFESQDAAVEGILGNKIKAGDVVRRSATRGRAGGPGMQEMLYPTSYLKSKGLGKSCALVTDGRFSGGSSGLSIGHMSPEAAEGGTDRAGGGRRQHRDRHSRAFDPACGRR